MRLNNKFVEKPVRRGPRVPRMLIQNGTTERPGTGNPLTE